MVAGLLLVGEKARAQNAKGGRDAVELEVVFFACWERLAVFVQGVIGQAKEDAAVAVMQNGSIGRVLLGEDEGCPVVAEIDDGVARSRRCLGIGPAFLAVVNHEGLTLGVRGLGRGGRNLRRLGRRVARLGHRGRGGRRQTLGWRGGWRRLGSSVATEVAGQGNYSTCKEYGFHRGVWETLCPKTQARKVSIAGSVVGHLGRIRIFHHREHRGHRVRRRRASRILVRTLSFSSVSVLSVSSVVNLFRGDYEMRGSARAACTMSRASARICAKWASPRKLSA